MLRASGILLLSLSCVVYAGACNYTEVKTSASPTPTASASGALTWASLNSQIFSAKCVVCHGTSGGIAVDSYAKVKSNISKINTAVVVNKSMPPTGPLSDADIKLLADWIAAGTPETSASDSLEAE